MTASLCEIMKIAMICNRMINQEDRKQNTKRARCHQSVLPVEERPQCCRHRTACQCKENQERNDPTFGECFEIKSRAVHIPYEEQEKEERIKT